MFDTVPTSTLHNRNTSRQFKPQTKASKPFSSFSTFLPTFQIVDSRGILLYPRIAFSQGCTRWSWWSTIGQCRWVKCINGLLSKFWGVGEGSTCNMVRGVCVCVFSPSFCCFTTLRCCQCPIAQGESRNRSLVIYSLRRCVLKRRFPETPKGFISRNTSPYSNLYIQTFSYSYFKSTAVFHSCVSLSIWK